MAILRKITGLLLILGAIIGLVFSIGGIIGLRQFEPKLTLGVQNTVDLLSQTLATTSDGLVITKGALESSVATISALETTVQTTASTVKSSTPMVGEISRLMEEDLPNTINATEASLRSAQNSAKMIDSLLGMLGGVPVIGRSLNYNPEVPLADALGDVADSIGKLPDSLTGIQASLEDTTTSLDTFEADLSTMASAIAEIEKTVSQYGSVIQGYQSSIGVIQTQLEGLKTNAGTNIHFLVLALTIFLIWMAISQLGLLTQGWELLTENREGITAFLQEAKSKAEEKNQASD